MVLFCCAVIVAWRRCKASTEVVSSVSVRGVDFGASDKETSFDQTFKAKPRVQAVVSNRVNDVPFAGFNANPIYADPSQNQVALYDDGLVPGASHAGVSGVDMEDSMYTSLGGDRSVYAHCEVGHQAVDHTDVALYEEPSPMQQQLYDDGVFAGFSDEMSI
jgi:hypothetical protein